MRNVAGLLLFLIISLFIYGCGAGKTVVMEPVSDQTNSRVSSVKIEQLQATCNVPDEASVEFRNLLNEKLYAAERFREGDELVIKYRFVQFDEGSQFERWFWGGIGNAGEGTLTVEASFCDSKGNVISKIQSEGKISSGFFGGDINFALEKASEEITQYAIANFK